MKIYRFITVIIGLSLAWGCSGMKSATEHPYELAGYESSNHLINSGVQADSAMMAFINPYRDSMQTRLSEVIAQSTGNFRVTRPEGALGNLAADMLLRRASRELRRHVDIGIMNLSHLEASLTSGPVTVGNIYRLMPYDYKVVVLKLTGEQVLELANEVAINGGEAISGMRMGIRNGKAVDVLVGSQNVQPDSIYLVATSSYLANGNGDLSALWNPVDTIDLDLLVRNVMIDYMQTRRVINPVIDNRIRM